MEHNMAEKSEKQEKNTKVTYKAGDNFINCDTQSNFWGLGQENYGMLSRGGSVSMEPADAEMALKQDFIAKAN